jgi:hypothetical protein
MWLDRSRFSLRWRPSQLQFQKEAQDVEGQCVCSFQRQLVRRFHLNSKAVPGDIKGPTRALQRPVQELSLQRGRDA